MQLIAFPGHLDSIRQSIALASISPNHWSSVLSALEEIFPNSIASIDRLYVGRSDFLYLSKSIDPQATPHAASGELHVDPSAHPRGSIFALKDWPLLLGPAAGIAVRREGDGASLHGAGIVLEWSGPWVSVFTLRVSDTIAHMHMAVVAARLRQISAELCEAYAVSRGRIPVPYESDTIEEIWDRLFIGVALFNSRLEPLATNMAAKDALGSRRYFAPNVRGARLRAIRAQDNDRLWSAAENVVYGESERECFSISGACGKQSLPILFGPVTQRSAADRHRTTTSRHCDTILALIGSWNVEDAVRDVASASA